jgi:NADH-quinone oxidoreductase subunit E
MRPDVSVLTDEEITEIETEAGKYFRKSAASVEALKIVQRHRGWVPDDALRQTALLLDMTAHELDAVATFYNLIFRRPVGRHVILLCDSISCYLTGEEGLYSFLSGKLCIGFGETTPDGRFTILPAVCLGFCEHAPAMMVDGELYGDLVPERVLEVLDKYR